MYDPFSVSCPTCDARKNKPCVYIWPKDWDGSPRIRHHYLAAGITAQMDRAGTETKRPHTERYRKAWLKAQVNARKQREAEYAAANELVNGRDAILKANAQAIVDEQNQLITWLKSNAHIFNS